MSPGRTEVTQGKFVEYIFPAKGYFTETNKSQNINPISPTPKSTFGIIQIKVKSLSTSFQWLVQYKINLNVCVCFYVSLYFIPLNFIYNTITFRIYFML